MTAGESGAMEIASRAEHKPSMAAITLEDLPPMRELGTMWRKLEVGAAGSFFTSWTWIEAWLKTYAVEAKAKRLLVARYGPRVVALAIICRTTQRRLLGGTETAVVLHQTGSSDDEAAFIEYNGFLIGAGAPEGIAVALLKFIDTAPAFTHGAWAWNEFRLAGIDRSMEDALSDSHFNYRITRESICPWVDLETLPTGIDGYLGAVSANTRGQIRRAMRLYEASGPLVVTQARSDGEAELFLRELRTLHEESWRRRAGNPGAFSFPIFGRFAAALIEKGLNAGNVDLLRVSAGGRTIGILLNFVHAGQVYAYQSGLAYSTDNRLKPGLVTHALAVAHYKSLALCGYHFMAGDGRYKTSLGTDQERLFWVSVRRPDFKSRLEDALRDVRGRLQGAKEASKTVNPCSVTQR